PPPERPTLVPLATPAGALAKLAVVGSTAQIQQAETLLKELDPSATRAGEAPAAESQGEIRARIVPLHHVPAREAVAAIGHLLSPRQRAAVRFAPSPDGRGVVLAGREADVDVVRELLEAVDAAPQVEREVRQVRLECEDPAG